jgi:peroxiredoxin
VVGVSADPPARLLDWSRQLGLPFRLLSDTTPPGGVGRLFGLWDDLWRVERRATLIVDRSSRIRFKEDGGACIDTTRTLDALVRLARAR